MPGNAIGSLSGPKSPLLDRKTGRKFVEPRLQALGHQGFVEPRPQLVHEVNLGGGLGIGRDVESGANCPPVP